MVWPSGGAGSPVALPTVGTPASVVMAYQASAYGEVPRIAGGRNWCRLASVGGSLAAAFEQRYWLCAHGVELGLGAFDHAERNGKGRTVQEKVKLGTELIHQPVQVLSFELRGGLGKGAPLSVARF